MRGSLRVRGREMRPLGTYHVSVFLSFVVASLRLDKARQEECAGEERLSGLERGRVERTRTW